MVERVFGEGWFEQSGSQTKLIGSQCKDCQTYWFPKRKICPDCFSEKLIEKKLSNTGEVYSLTTLHVASKLFETPLTIAYVDFPEGVRICGQVEGKAEIGGEVEPTFGQIRTDSDGVSVFSYKFRTLK